MIKAVLYTDGGAQPNPGLSGWAGHGYIFNDVPVKKKYVSNINITEFGYSTEKLDNVDVIKFFNFLGSEGINTNNASEINSLYYSLNKLLEEGIEYVHIYVDSEYLRRGILEWSSKWIRNNWVREDGNPVSNQKEWKRLLAVLEVYKENNIGFDIEWIKGHSGDVGNTIADTLCNIAINYLRDGRNPGEDYRYYEPYLYWEEKPERHPYLYFKRLFFNSSSKSPIGYYFLEDSDLKEEKYIGKKHNNTTYSVIKLNDPIAMIEEIKQKQNSVAEDFNVVMLLKLDKIYNPAVYQYLKEYGTASLYRANNYSVSLNYLDNKPITLELDPPGLSLYAMQSFKYMEDILNSYLENTIQHTVIDITDKIYVKEIKNKKEIYVLNPKIKPGLAHTEIQIEHKGRTFNIKLIIGGELLPRNNLKRLESLNPSIQLILIDDTENSFSFMVLTNSSLGVGIWANLHTNSIYF